MFHPATWIGLWSAFAILLQILAGRELAAVAVPAAVVAALTAAPEVLRLVQRARWLLLAIGILFAFATPGERLAPPFGAVGLTADGLVAAAEHLLRLIALLATLAWLWRVLGRDGLMTGLHCLLRPLGARRDRIVVRLALALEYVEGDAPSPDWRTWLDRCQPEADVCRTVRLVVKPLAPVDRVALLGCGAVLLLVAIR